MSDRHGRDMPAIRQSSQFLWPRSVKVAVSPGFLEGEAWRPRRDSNLRPADWESAAKCPEIHRKMRYFFWTSDYTPNFANNLKRAWTGCCGTVRNLRKDP